MPDVDILDSPEVGKILLRSDVSTIGIERATDGACTLNVGLVQQPAGDALPHKLTVAGKTVRVVAKVLGEIVPYSSGGKARIQAEPSIGFLS